MTTRQLLDDRLLRANLLILGQDDAPVLIAEIKGVQAVPETIDRLVAALGPDDLDVPFGLLADPWELRFYRPGSTAPAATLDTRELLRRYAPGHPDGSISTEYLGALLEVWLLDLETHWDSSHPPGSDVMAALGLQPRLVGGTIDREVDLAAYRVR